MSNFSAYNITLPNVALTGTTATVVITLNPTTVAGVATTLSGGSLVAGFPVVIQNGTFLAAGAGPGKFTYALSGSGPYKITIALGSAANNDSIEIILQANIVGGGLVQNTYNVGVGGSGATVLTIAGTQVVSGGARS